MTTEKGLTIREDRQVAIQELETRFAMAVRQRELLENYIRERLKPDKHFYKVGDDPGRKPSLTKEGAELICLPHNLKPRYMMLSGPDKPPPDNSPYQITVNCSLWRGDTFEGEGIGSASSYITTRTGEYKPRQKDPGLCHNATLKMAQKSAYIAATLNSTAASEFFTQDLEDDQAGLSDVTDAKEHWCKEHNTIFFMKGKMKSFAHPIGDTGEWCHEHKESPAPLKTKPPATVEAVESPIPNSEPDKVVIDLNWLKDSLQELNWNTVIKYLKEKYGVTGSRVGEIIPRLTELQQREFALEVERRLKEGHNAN